ncbi:hypothetical protein MTP03_40640 [Tsukamurella sp. PLM1]|nr:hypothetical protein MTP03_40640 [Tsukamurella sp. PLM1]
MHPAQPGVGAHRLGEQRGLHVGNAEQGVGPGEELGVRGLLRGRALEGRVALPVGVPASGAVERVVARQLHAGLETLDQEAVGFGQVDGEGDAERLRSGCHGPTLEDRTTYRTPFVRLDG